MNIDVRQLRSVDGAESGREIFRLQPEGDRPAGVVDLEIGQVEGAGWKSAAVG